MREKDQSGSGGGKKQPKECISVEKKKQRGKRQLVSLRGLLRRREENLASESKKRGPNL